MRQALLASIAGTISDYRAGEISAPDAAHVDQWVSQFDQAAQLPLLQEIDHVLKNTYVPRTEVQKFMNTVATSQNLCGGAPAQFWNDVFLLDIQTKGASQKEFNAELCTVLAGAGISSAASAAQATKFVYLDDGLFTGNRILGDLRTWIANAAPSKCELHVIVIALYAGGHYYAETEIKKAIASSGKVIDVQWWSSIKLENRNYYRSNSDVFWPVALPNDADVQAYAGGLGYPISFRPAGSVGARAFFSSDTGRQLVEQELLKAGVKIRKQSPLIGDTNRPLGHSTLKTLGFGSTIVTYRNCPNNAPLAFWAGDPWYPLFPRKTNTDTEIAQMFGKS